ncbi:MAG: hypothetical protein ACOYOQ_15815 [Microthrixaceae bacterium]
MEIELSSQLAASADVVWGAASSMEGVNREVLPLVRMTYPADRANFSAESVAPGRVVFHSWLLVGGVIPVDRHALSFESFDAAGRFVEESTSWLQRRWRHERIVAEPSPERCTVTDRLLIEPRLTPASPLVKWAVTRVFRHRHRRLQQRFGAP